MAQYRFLLDSQEIEHPLGWDAINFVFEDDGRAMFKSIDDTFTFCNDGYGIIERAIQQTPCNKLPLEIQYNVGEGWLPFVHLYLSLLDIELDCIRCQAKVPGSSLGLADFVETCADTFIFPADERHEVFETESGVFFDGEHSFTRISSLLDKITTRCSNNAYSFYSEFFIKSFRKNIWRVDVSGGLNGTATIQIDAPFGKRRAIVNGAFLTPEQFGKTICNALHHFGEAMPTYDQLITDPVAYAYYDDIGIINPNVVYIESWWPISVSFEINGASQAPFEYQPWQYGGREMVISGLGLKETYQELSPIKLINTLADIFSLKYELNDDGQIHLDEKGKFYDTDNPVEIEVGDSIKKVFNKVWRKDRFDISHEFGLSPSIEDTQPGQSHINQLANVKHIGVSNIYDNGAWEKIRFGDVRFDEHSYFNAASYAYAPKHKHKAKFYISFLAKGVDNAVVTVQIRDSQRVITEGIPIQEFTVNNAGSAYVVARVLIFELELDVEANQSYTVFAKTDSLSLPMTIFTDEVYTQLTISEIGITNDCYGGVGNDENTWKQVNLTQCAGVLEKKPDTAFYGGLGYAFDQQKYGVTDYSKTHFFADYDNITRGLLKFRKGVFFSNGNTCYSKQVGGANQGEDVENTIPIELSFYNIPIQPAFILYNWIKSMPYNLISYPYYYADVVVTGSDYAFRDIQFETQPSLIGSSGEGFLYELETCLSPVELRNVLKKKAIQFNYCDEIKVGKVVLINFDIRTGKSSMVAMAD